MRAPAHAALLLPLLLLAALGPGCGGNEYVEPPAPGVTVSPPLERHVTDYLEFTGNTRAVAQVELRARVQGFLQAQHYEEGTFVEEGDLLFTIDPSEYEANLQRAKAAVNVGHASVELTSARLQRLEKALKTRAVSEIEVLEERARVREAKASLDAAKAARTRAELDLSYTQIIAPMSGRAGRRRVDLGNLVGAGEQTLLTTLVQYDPIEVYFDLSERQVLALANATGGLKRRQSNTTPVEIARSTDEGYPYRGLLNYSDQGVDPATGTILLRATFANPAPFEIVPGLFVRGRVPIDQREGALLVSERAIGSDQSGTFVLVVDGQGVVEQKIVKLGARIDGMRVVESGLERDDSVIIDGILRARPGAKVTAQRAGADPVDVAAPPEPDGG